jgi:hypothetical protein
VGQGAPAQRSAEARALAHLVKALTRELFRQVLFEINEWLALANQAPLRRPVGDVHTRWEVDNKLVLWMRAMFLEGFQSVQGSLAIAAVKYLWPEFGHRGALRLPLAEQALRGWRHLSLQLPGLLTDQLPLPWEAVALIAEDMIVHGDPWMGILTVLSFCCDFHPSEPLRIKGGDLVPPRWWDGHRFWSIRLLCRSGPNTTVVVDQSPLISLLESGLRRLKTLRGINELVFQFT